VRAVRQALAGVGLSEPRRRGERDAIRVLLATRAQATPSSLTSALCQCREKTRLDAFEPKFIKDAMRAAGVKENIGIYARADDQVVAWSS
jgi:hypothetical protein